MQVFRKLQAFFNPEQFQGWGKRRKYFEGWYYKLVNAAEDKALAIIPGIAMDEQGNRQAFVQVLDGKRKTAVYHNFDFSSFSATPGKLLVHIGENSFSEKHISLSLPGMRGELNFSGNIPWPKPFLFSRYHGAICFCTIYGMLPRYCEYGPYHQR